MAITSIVGKIGSGKSLKQIAYALEQANLKRKKIVTNFSLDLRELRRYCGMKKYGWVAHLIDTNQFSVVDAANDICSLFSDRTNSIICLDEAGIFLNSREFAKTPKKLLADLAQSRKDGNDLIYAAQFDEQVDRQMRMLTQWFIYANGVSVYDKALKRPRLYWLNYYYFDAEAYFCWDEDIKAKASFLKTWFAAFKTESRPVSAADLQLFKVFDSFARLDSQAALVRSASYQPYPTGDDGLAFVKKQSALVASSRNRKGFLGHIIEVPQDNYYSQLGKELYKCLPNVLQQK